MPLRILFADDSMTAQNMGKKILTEAGYDVVAVSNGAAAVKKIAEQKPDIIILDVYMPGYSGLEVCEKVRASLETAKTPVLLTVGKMEPPPKPEDANRVKADGVIIKPFEASDLLAIIKKFEERIGHPPPPPLVEQTVLLERRFVEDALSGAAEPQLEHHATGKTGSQPMVEVPDHMATSAAFSDLLGADPSHSMSHYSMSTPAPAFETSVVAPASPPSAEYELPVSWSQEDEEEPVAGIPVMVGSAEADPVTAEPKIEAYPSATETSFDLVPIEAPPIPDPAFTLMERFGAISEPAKPVAEVASIADASSFEAVPIMEAEPTVEAPSSVEAVPIVPEAIVDAATEEVPIAVEPPLEAPPVLADPAPPRPRYIPVYREPEPSSYTVESTSVLAAPAPARPQYIPVYRESEPEASGYEVVPTAAAPTEEMDIPREPALLESAEEATRNTVADLQEPGLMPTIIQEPTIEESATHESVEYFPAAETSAGETAEIAPIEAEERAESSLDTQAMTVSEIPAEVPVGTLPANNLSRSPAIDSIADVNDFDFEARVAAAMAAYNQMPGAEAPLAPAGENQPAISAENTHSGVPTNAHIYARPVESEAEAEAAEAVTAEAAQPEFEPAPSFEYYPPIRVPELPRVIDRSVVETPAMAASALPVVEPVPPPAPLEEIAWAASPTALPEPAVVESPAPSARHDAAVSAGLEAALPTAVTAAAEETGADHDTITQVVNRVMERLKTEMVDEIMRELKSKK